MAQTLREHVEKTVATEAADLHALSAPTDGPFTALVGHIDAKRDSYVGAVATHQALSHVSIGGGRTLLDATSSHELRLAIDVLTAVRVALASASGPAAASPAAAACSFAMSQFEPSRA